MFFSLKQSEAPGARWTAQIASALSRSSALELIWASICQALRMQKPWNEANIPKCGKIANREDADPHSQILPKTGTDSESCQDSALMWLLAYPKT